MSEKTKLVFEFGRFRLDPVERVLLADGQRVALTPKAFETLLALLEDCGHLLEKDKLLKRIWPDSFVEEGTLVQNISTLRKVLGEAPDGTMYIETVPRRGYRFCGAVREVHLEQDSEKPVRSGGVFTSERTARPYWVIGPAVAVALIFTLYVVEEHVRPHKQPISQKVMLAVLPFENLSGNVQQEYLSAGLTEELITQLGSLEPARLGVIARTSAMQYKDSHKDVRQISRELGVDYVLEGSVRRDADHVRITAQLIQSRDQTHVWAKEYDGNLSDILALQGDVARAVAREIQLRLTPEETARLAVVRPVDAEAYELYLKGRYFWNKRTVASYLKAIEYFKAAISRDPKYAQAYTGLADAYALLGSVPNNEMRRKDAMPKAKAAALTALQLDESLAEAHTALAFEEMHYEWDWPSAEGEFKRALELNPNYATAHQWYAIWFVGRGSIDQALSQLSLADKADPLSLVIKADTADVLNCAGRYEQAAQVATRALELDPNFVLAHYALADSYVRQQQYPQAMAEYQKVLATDSGNVWARVGIARVFALTGQRPAAERLLKEVLKACGSDGCFYEISNIYYSLGERDQGIEWLERAYQAHEGALIFLNAGLPQMLPQPDPRYADLARRVDLAINPDKALE